MIYYPLGVLGHESLSTLFRSSQSTKCSRPRLDSSLRSVCLRLSIPTHKPSSWLARGDKMEKAPNFGAFSILSPRQESNLRHRLRKLASYPLNDEGYLPNLPIENMVGVPGFEPGVACTQNRNVSRYTTPRPYLQFSSTQCTKSH